MANDSTFIVNGLRIPWGMISEEVEGLYSSTILSEFRDIIGYYDIYENGAPFTPEIRKLILSHLIYILRKQES